MSGWRPPTPDEENRADLIARLEIIDGNLYEVEQGLGEPHPGDGLRLEWAVGHLRKAQEEVRALLNAVREEPK